MSKETHLVKDPVCGHQLKPKQIQARATYHEKTYYFCSETCQTEFESRPRSYVKLQAA